MVDFPRNVPILSERDMLRIGLNKINYSDLDRRPQDQAPAAIQVQIP